MAGVGSLARCAQRSSAQRATGHRSTDARHQPILFCAGYICPSALGDVHGVLGTSAGSRSDRENVAARNSLRFTSSIIALSQTSVRRRAMPHAEDSQSALFDKEYVDLAQTDCGATQSQEPSRCEAISASFAQPPVRDLIPNFDKPPAVVN